MREALAAILLATVGEAATIAGRIIDADTGQTVPATVTIHTSAGKIVTDHAAYAAGFRCPGSFEKEIPVGETVITVTRGFDYLPVERRITVQDGPPRTETFEIHRRSPLRREGWYVSDHHAHMIHGERNTVVDFRYVALAGRAEGLDFLSVAQAWNLPQPTPEELERATRAVSTPDFTLTWNLEAPKNYYRGDAGKCLGHGWTVGMRGRTHDRRDAVAELLEISAHDYESEKPPFANFESQALVHSLGGIVSYTHPVRWWTGKWGGRDIYPVEEKKFISNMATELPFDTIAGPTYDSIDVLMPPQEKVANGEALKLWFMLLNHGYRIPASASSDATFDNPGRGVSGKVRIYTHIEGEPDIGNVAEAIKAGRSFVTSGPLLTLDIAGGKGKIRAWADHLTRLELIRNGDIVRTFDPVGKSEFTTGFDVNEPGRAWYIARCYGADETQIAITNPIWFEPPPTPQPTPARVTLDVVDQSTGKPLDGWVEVIRMVGKERVVESKSTFHAGKVALTVPGTARLRVQAAGYQPVTKSVFLDYPPLLDLATHMRPQQLTDWRTFEKIRELLQNVTLGYRLSRP